MNRYDIILGKTPPPVVPAIIPKLVPAELNKIKESLLSSFPFHIEDISISENIEDPSVININVLYRLVRPIDHISTNFNFIPNRNNDVFNTPSLGSDLHRRMFSPQFFETVTSPVDSNARIPERLLPADTRPFDETGRFNGRVQHG
jgi:hypothetical protein